MNIFFKIVLIIGFLILSCTDKKKVNECWFEFKGECFAKPVDYTSSDSSELRKKAEQLATDEILFAEAKQKLGEDPDLEEKINSYRKKLYIHELENKIIENNLDTLISEKELMAYYQEHSSEYLLSQTIVKLIYTRVASDNKQLKKIQTLAKNLTPDKEKEFYELASMNAVAFTDFNRWIFLDDIKKNIPFLKNVSADYLMPGKTFEFFDNNEWVYLKIIDRRNQNSASPFGLIKNELKRGILKERASELLKAYRKQLLEEAKQKGDLKTF